MGNIEFKNPQAFYLLIPVILLCLLYIYLNRKKIKGYLYSNFSILKEFRNKWINLGSHICFVSAVVAMIFFIIALARPRKVSTSKEVNTYGVDISIAFDISTSMRALDFKPENRFKVARGVIKDFIEKRKEDRISLIIFAGEAFTQCPLTFDKSLIKRMLSNIETGMLKDGTAIGDALTLSAKRLKESNAKSKIIILVTDGNNNSGTVEPLTAAEIAQDNNIKIYTIGVGKRSGGRVPVKTKMGTKWARIEPLNESSLIKIAEKTNGVYRRAESKEELEEIYEYINKNEKSKIEVKKYKNVDEKFSFFLHTGFVLTVLSFLWGLVFYKIE